MLRWLRSCSRAFSRACRTASSLCGAAAAPPPRGRRRGQAGFALNDNDDRGWIEPFWDELGLVLLDVVPRGAV